MIGWTRPSCALAAASAAAFTPAQKLAHLAAYDRTLEDGTGGTQAPGLNLWRHAFYTSAEYIEVRPKNTDQTER